MAKFYDAIGFEELTESVPGAWTPVITEHFYYGDVIKNARRNRQTDKINDDIILDVSISIIADDFATLGISKMKYIKYMGSKWKITSISIQHPRIILGIGGIYNV